MKRLHLVVVKRPHLFVVKRLHLFVVKRLHLFVKKRLHWYRFIKRLHQVPFVKKLHRIGWICLSLLCGCSGEQSALAGMSSQAERINQLSWLMFYGAAAITLLVVGLTLTALFGSSHWRRRFAGEQWVVGLGIIFPVVLLSVLLVYGFWLLREDALPVAEGEPVRIAVVGEQWWWRVIYHHPDGTTTESANELRFPVGRPVELSLTTADVIHSFWLPSYAGKVDMIPGRTNYLRFVAHKPGVARGQCAEYCGGAHALMAFYGVAMAEADYQKWLARERRDAVVAPNSDAAGHFLANGCGACHRVRGTAAAGVMGPDLTHIGSRLSVGAGILEADHQGFQRWIADHQRIKPDNLMPPYAILDAAEVRALATYLTELE